MLALWAGYKMENQLFENIIQQCNSWLNLHQNPIFEDGLFYWRGISELQTSKFADAIQSFDSLLQQYPTSLYRLHATL